MSSYPEKIDTDVTVPVAENNVTQITADTINSIRDAILNTEKALGINIQGNTSDLAARISISIDSNGNIKPDALALVGLVTLPIYDAQIAENANIQETKLALTYTTSGLNSRILSVQTQINDVNIELTNINNQFTEHLSGTVHFRHDGYDVDVVSPIRGGTTVEAALHDIDNALVNHETSLTQVAHTASVISVVNDFAGFSATNVQEALNELDTSKAGQIESHQARAHINAVESDTLNELDQINLSKSTLASTIFQTDKTLATNILRIMRPNVARITSEGINLRGLQSGLASVLRVQVGGMLYLDIDLSSLPSALPTQNIDDVVAKINSVAGSASNHYPVSAYNTDGELTIAHNIPGVGNTIQILSSFALDASSVLGFGNVVNNVYSCSSDGYAAYVDGQRIIDVQTTLDAYVYNYVGGNLISPNFGSLDAYGLVTSFPECSVLCNVTNAAPSSVNGTYYITSFTPDHSSFYINTNIIAGASFNISIVADSINFPSSANGEIYDIFLQAGLDGYGKIAKQHRLSYGTIPFVSIRSISKDFVADSWSTVGNTITLYSQSQSGVAVDVPINYVGSLQAFASDNIGCALFELSGGPSYLTRSVTVYPFFKSENYLYLSSVHYGGNFGPQTLKYITDKRQFGGTPENISNDTLLPKEFGVALNDLRNNGIFEGLDVISNTTTSFKIRGGKVLVNGNIFDITTQNITVNNFGSTGAQTNWLLLIDKTGELIIKNETDPGFSLADLVSGDSYGDNRDVALVVEFITDGTLQQLTGTFNDKRLILSKIDKKLLDLTAIVDSLAAPGIPINTATVPLNLISNNISLSFDNDSLKLNGGNVLYADPSVLPHNELADLTGSDDHTQYLLLAGNTPAVGRSIPQEISGDVKFDGNIINVPLKTALDGYQVQIDAIGPKSFAAIEHACDGYQLQINAIDIACDGYVTSAIMDAYVFANCVPYVGATTSIDIGAHDLTIGGNIINAPLKIALDGYANGASGVLGAIQFSNGAGKLSSDDAYLHWDDVSHRLGIGIVSPQSSLSIKGGMELHGSTLTSFFYYGANQDNYIRPGTLNGCLKIDEGNVGIGPGFSVPLNKLDINGAAVVGVAYAGTNLAPTNGLLVQGNIGLGTASPNANASIDIFSSTQLQDRIRLSGQEYYQPGHSSTDGIVFRLGINRTDNRQLWIADSASAIGSAAVGFRVLVGTATNQAFIDAVSTDGTTAKDLIINGYGGNVGVGILLPTAKLHVAGGNISCPGSGGAGSEQFGSGSNASGNSSTAIGYNTTASGTYSVAIGNGITAGQFSVGVGSGASVWFGTAIGFSVSIGQDSVGIGAFASASGDYAVAVGGAALGNGCVGLGAYAHAGEPGFTGINSIAIGSAITKGAHSIAIGDGAESDYDNAIALGRGATTIAINQMEIGCSAYPVSVRLYSDLTVDGYIINTPLKNALDGYVPYVGAKSDVSLGAHYLTLTSNGRNNAINATGAGDGCGGYFTGGGNQIQTTLSTGQTSAAYLSADSSNIYWATYSNSGNVMQVPIGGGAPITLASSQTYPCGVASDDSYVYWCSQPGVYKTPIGGGSSILLVSSPQGGQYSYSITVDDAYIYWTDYTTSGTVRMANKSDGSDVVTLASSQWHPIDIVSDGSYVYWTTSSIVSIYCIRKCDIHGSHITTTLVTDVSNTITGFAIDNNYVYWSTGPSGNSIMKASIIDGTNSTTLMSGLNSPYKVAVNATYIYWTDYAGNTVLKANKFNGGNIQTILSGQNNPQCIIIDASNGYFINSGDWTIKQFILNPGIGVIGVGGSFAGGTNYGGYFVGGASGNAIKADGYMAFKNVSGLPTAISGYGQLYSKSDGYLYFESGIAPYTETNLTNNSSFVPYVGATTDVNLGVHGLTVSNVNILGQIDAYDLACNINVSCTKTISRTDGYISNILYQTPGDANIRQVSITRSLGVITSVAVIQYDSAGSENERMTGTINRIGGLISSVDWVRTG